MSPNEDQEFLYPRYPYRGEVKPENVVFNANLQEFAQAISYICNLETAGKIKPEQAYARIKQLWKNLKLSKKNLKIGENLFEQNLGEEDGDDIEN
ncbi:MAG: citramalate synthase [Crocosphaera sp.]|nr:citramalate synthase [Crocosphaera sp.]